MRVRNKLKGSASYRFAGTGPSNSCLLKAGGISPKLPPQRYYDPMLQDALKKGYIEVIFDEEDVGILGVVGIPGPVAKVLSKLDPKPESSESGEPIVTKPVVVSAKREPKSKKPEPEPEPSPRNGAVRASALARELMIPFHTLQAGMQSAFNIKVFQMSYVKPEHAEAMRKKYGEHLEVPEISAEPVKRKAEIRTISDLTAKSDGIVSLSDLISQNRGGS